MDHMQASKKMPKWIIFLIIGAVILLLGLGAFLFLNKKVAQATPVETVASLVEQQVEHEKNLLKVDQDFTNPKIVIDPYGISPLTALIMFKTREPIAATVTIKGKDALSTFSHTFNSVTEHRLPIYGLYAGTDNQVEIKVGNETKTFTIKTAPLPENFPKVVEIKAQKQQLNNQLYFVTGSTATAKTAAYDVNGDVRWYLSKNFGWEIKRISSGKLLISTERLISEPYYNTGLYEMDLLGKIYTEYTLAGGYHHDYFERKNGNFIIATSSTNEGRKTVEDTIIEIDRRSGNTIKTIDLTQILPTNTGKSLSWSADDWFHNNSVWLNETTGELLVSGRHQDAIAVIDYEKSQLKYIIGSPEDWSEDMQRYFLTPVGKNFEWQWQQHAAKTLPNGDVLVFDNGNNKTKDSTKAVPATSSYSRAVIYRVNRTNRTIEQIWQYGKERGKNYFSPYISEVDFLEEGHFLVHSGGVNSKDGQPSNLPATLAGANLLRSYTTELLKGQVVFELVLDQNYYRAEKMPIYSKNESSLILGKARQVGSLKQAQSCTNLPLSRALNISEKEVSAIYEPHNIAFKKEQDRLVINGVFDKNDIIKVSLLGDGRQHTFDISTGRNLNTQAMCIDIFSHKQTASGENKDVIGFINAVGLSGKYRIYLSINDKIFDTAKAVTF